VPRTEVMGAIGFLALAANLAAAGLLYCYRFADSQAMSVWLCTRNNCIANIASSSPVLVFGRRQRHGRTSP
jgi:hypothetical protein